MESFKYVIDSNVTLVPLNRVLISLPMRRALISKGCNIPKEFLLDISAPNIGNLNRMEMFSDQKNIYPPIVIQKLDFGYYSIIDGRHRVTMSILKEYSFIPAIIIK